jgi:glyceraldehyde-3-phosphate dehydrogenase/erythrose-4-phosphate dehydrogenase
MTKVAINGFGRIGRLVARAILERPESGLELVTINDLADAKSNAWLFSRDSVHGRYPGTVSALNPFSAVPRGNTTMRTLSASGTTQIGTSSRAFRYEPGRMRARKTM